MCNCVFPLIFLQYPYFVMLRSPSVYVNSRKPRYFVSNFDDIVWSKNVSMILNSSPHGQNGHHFADDIFKCISMNEVFCILIRISLKFVPKGVIGNKPALVLVMAWRRIGDRSSPEPMLTQLSDAYLSPVYVPWLAFESLRFFCNSLFCRWWICYSWMSATVKITNCFRDKNIFLDFLSYWYGCVYSRAITD